MQPLSRKYNGSIQCLLCPHFCKIAEGKTGICRVRKNTGSGIELVTYGVISGLAIDPVEKKPLYHFFPGKKILSIGSYGCNMRCDFCQNYHISQNLPGSITGESSPDEIAARSERIPENIGIAFTYNEPVIWFEYITDTARAIKDKGLYTAVITNGYINPDPLSELLDISDAFNVDLKAFNNDFYKKLTGATLDPVKSSLKQIVKGGKHLEITTLLINGQNDDINEMKEQTQWIAGELGPDIPFHLSRYFPRYKRDDPATPETILQQHYDVARKYLSFVYVGNTNTETALDTFCPDCGTVITRRSGYTVHHVDCVNGRCSRCGKVIYKFFTFSS